MGQFDTFERLRQNRAGKKRVWLVCECNAVWSAKVRTDELEFAIRRCERCNQLGPKKIFPNSAKE